jgi:hypothetical protein
MFERVDGAWEKITRESVRFIDGLKVMYVSPEVIEIIDEMYTYSDAITETDLERYSTEALVESEKAGK